MSELSATSSSSSASSLNVFRIGIGLVAGSVVFMPFPGINLAGSLMSFTGAIIALVGLCLYVAAAPSGAGLGQALGLVGGLGVMGVVVTLQAVSSRWVEMPVLVIGLSCLSAAGVAFLRFWMKAAEAINALRAAEGFRVPMIFSVIVSIISIGLVAVEAPPAAQVVPATLGFIGFVTYWWALSALKHALTLGPGEYD